jgi:hypothetical protein
MSTSAQKAIHALDHMTPAARKAQLGVTLAALVDGYNKLQADFAAVAGATATAAPAGYVAPTLTSGQIAPLTYKS